MSTSEIIAELPRLSAAELAEVRAKLAELPLIGTAVTATRTAPVEPLAVHPALGVWKDRTDLPADSVDASRALREQLMHRSDPVTS